MFKFHPDLTPPPRDDKGYGAAILYPNMDKRKKHTDLTQIMDNSCVLCGGEGINPSMQTYSKRPQPLSVLTASREGVVAYLYKIEAVAVFLPHIDLEMVLHGSFVAGTRYRR